jgi:integrase
VRIYKRGESRFYWVYFVTPDGRVIRQSTGHEERRRAEAFGRDLERRECDPTYSAAHETTLGDAIVNFKTAVKDRGRAKGTQDMYDVKTRHLARLIGVDTPMAKITATVVDDYMKSRKDEGASKSTIYKELVALRGLLKVARRRGEFDKELSQVMPVGYGDGYKPKDRVLDRRELVGLLFGLPLDVGAWLCAAVATGARLSELGRMRRSDIDTKAGRVRIHGTKTVGARGTIPIVSATRPLLDFALEHGREGERLLPTWGRVRPILDRTRKAAGLKHITPNDLRRTFATWMVEGGVPIDVVARLMRHRDTRMVALVYGKPTDQADGELIERAFAAKKEDPS